MKCPLCKKEFNCDIDLGYKTCWCFKYNLENIDLKEIKNKNCICEECIKKLIKSVNN